MERGRQEPGEPYRRISVEEAREMQQEGALIVDVRRPDEWAAGRAAGAVHIPVDDFLAEAEAKLPAEGDLLFICAAGVRSALAAEMAAALGFEQERLYNVEAGAPKWIEAELPTRLAEEMREEDAAANRAVGGCGAELLPESGGILTHCNTGALATAGYGTALGAIRAAWESGKRLRVFCTETRPWMQGARLTAWELARLGIPATLIVDSAAGALMASGRVSAVITGADRVAANGDLANKIGTYALAALAEAHRIPFYAAAPLSTVDFGTASGAEIPIEERPAEEVTSLAGQRVAAEGVDVWNPAFDVTPARLIAALATERGAARPPFEASLRALAERPALRGAA